MAWERVQIGVMLAAYAALSLPASAQSIVDGSGKDLAAELLDRTIAAVTRDLKDPISSQFKRVGHPMAGTKVFDANFVCGFVNGKNSFGGYTGFTPFAYDISKDKALLYDLENQRAPLVLQYAFKATPCLTR